MSIGNKKGTNCKSIITDPLSSLDIISPDDSITIVKTQPEGKTIFSLIVKFFNNLKTKNTNTINISGTGDVGNELRADLRLSQLPGNTASIQPDGIYISSTVTPIVYVLATNGTVVGDRNKYIEVLVITPTINSTIRLGSNTGLDDIAADTFIPAGSSQVIRVDKLNKLINIVIYITGIVATTEIILIER